MTTHYLHSGGLGDIIYALPYIRHHGGGVLHIKKSNGINVCADQFTALKGLLSWTGYVDPWPDNGICEYPWVDLNKFRAVADFQKPLPTTYFLAFGEPVPDDWSRRWLRAAPPKSPPYAVVHRTERYQDPAFDWKKVMAAAMDRYKGLVYFLGFRDEYLAFERACGVEIVHYPVFDLEVMAFMIEGADVLFCNQSVGLTIAQGLGRPYQLEVAPGFSSCILNLPNERLLNR